MLPSFSLHRIALASLLLLAVSGCDRDLDLLAPADFPSDADVFLDGYGAGVSFQAFAGSKTDAVQIDGNEAFRGDNSLRITVPAPGDPSGGYAGGAFVAIVGRDLTGYNALSFWAKGTVGATLDVAGLGNDNTGTSRYTAAVTNQFPLSSTWTRYVIPIPEPSKLTREQGLFYFAEGAEGGVGYTFWIDELEFVDLGTIADVRPAIPDQELVAEVGSTLEIEDATTTFDVAGTDVVVGTAPGYFTFASSDPGVALVDDAGRVELVGSGLATITATLGGVPAQGEITLRVAGPPTVAPPTPTLDGSEVTSLFSDAYDDQPVDTWSAEWDQADVADVQVGGDNVKRYTNLVFAGVEFLSAPVDASTRTGIHIDVWVQDPSDLRLKLVDLGPDGVFGGGNESESEIVLGTDTDPSLQVGQWNSLDIPFSAFPGGLPNRGALGQLILSGASSTLYVDNVYFYGEEVVVVPEPSEAAPTPTYAAEDVISLFSNAYTDVPVDTWSAEWDNASVEDVQVAGDDVKRYTGLGFAGVEAVSSTIDASAMTHFRMDVWTPSPTDAGQLLTVLLRDFGADGAFDGGDDTLHEIALDATTTPALGTGAWITLDIPLSDFAGLTTREHIAQIVVSGDLPTLYVDNVLFHR